MREAPQVSVEEEIALLLRGAEETFPEGELERKVVESRKTGRPLRVKLGIDPTATDLHLGHMIPILKLKVFQDLGHQVVLIIGDYTATVGDPAGQNKERPMLAHEDVLAFSRSYEEQAFRILDREKTEVVRNGTWFSKMGFSDVIRLMSEMTLARMLEREDFSNRYRAQVPISLHELIYPLMQGYDSVMIKADVELGGTDQKFNILVGRELQKSRGLEPQVGLCNPILLGLDGTEKMSKSLGNTIPLSAPPEEMYGKVMSMPDELMWMYFELVTEVPLSEIASLRRAIEEDGVNPRDVKKRLAREVVGRFYDRASVDEAERHFERVIGRGDAPEKMPEHHLSAADMPQGSIWVVNLIVQAGLAASRSEARRLVEQGGVKLDGETVTDPSYEWPARDGGVLQVGKRRYARIRLTSDIR